MDKDLLVLFSEFPGDGCALDELRAGPDDGENLHWYEVVGEKMMRFAASRATAARAPRAASQDS
jgi:hypothetical protein